MYDRLSTFVLGILLAKVLLTGCEETRREIQDYGFNAVSAYVCNRLLAERDNLPHVAVRRLGDAPNSKIVVAIYDEMGERGEMTFQLFAYKRAKVEELTLPATITVDKNAMTEIPRVLATLEPSVRIEGSVQGNLEGIQYFLFEFIESDIKVDIRVPIR